MSVGEPENKEKFDIHHREEVTVYLDKNFPNQPPNIMIQLKTKPGPPRLVASRKR